ncbi:MAG: Rrf2 family transcriptional regulator [Eubacterium sp.]|nr:Rrf2 family transcriptional regulator [Eubacterium sp.]
MKVSTRVEYGLVALTDIAINCENGESVSAPEIAERQHISRKYLEHILLLLRQAGFITAQKGLRGGYTLLRSPKEITLSDVLNALDTNILAEMDDKYNDNNLGTVINECFWDKINENLNNYVESITLSDFAEQCRGRVKENWDMYSI